jgi:hypothetical protein
VSVIIIIIIIIIWYQFQECIQQTVVVISHRPHIKTKQNKTKKNSSIMYCFTNHNCNNIPSKSLLLLFTTTVLLLLLNNVVAQQVSEQHKRIQPGTISIEGLTTNKLITVSGVSSGAMFAVQLHVAFSSKIKGAGVIAGGPFYCAQNNVAIALTACMSQPFLIVVPELILITENTALFGFIDNPSQFLRDARVFLFSGTNDNVVKSDVVRKAAEYYRYYISDPFTNVVEMYNVSAAHSWVNDQYGNPCSHLGSPYINNCGVDVPGKILAHVLNIPLKPRAKFNASNLFIYNQKDYVPYTFFTLRELGLMAYGFIYVPTACQHGGNASNCSLHIAFHGCEQDIAMIGDEFAVHSGLNEWAETNNIIILYPQAQSNLLNPKGCWDWWGYTGMQYASNLGFQMRTINNLMTAITSRTVTNK